MYMTSQVWSKDGRGCLCSWSNFFERVLHGSVHKLQEQGRQAPKNRLAAALQGQSDQPTISSNRSTSPLSRDKSRISNRY